MHVVPSTLCALLLAAVPLAATAQQSIEARPAPGIELTSAALERDARRQKFQQAFQREDRGSRDLPLSAIVVTEDCSAEVTCPNGTKLECSIQGPSTSCHSDGSGVACFKENSDGSVSGSSGTC